MTIDVERIEVLGANVSNLASARELFTKLFGLRFESVVLGAPDEISSERLPLRSGNLHPDPQSVQGRPTPLAIDTAGLFELIEAPTPDQADQMRNIHFKVADIEAATEEMMANGIRVVDNLRCGNLREVIFEPEDLFGIRLCFVQYEEPSIIEAMLANQESLRTP
ncbi:VOC family protein [Salinibacterium sp. ZJ454]|uniref:VOC family protein n=1 Tax=Salinibacterium sp. ZJ454 TaxID=2708339 RepID=UPI0014212667|nr:VOC family protein [Salinibacterium sp. ZJ454]